MPDATPAQTQKVETIMNDNCDSVEVVRVLAEATRDPDHPDWDVLFDMGVLVDPRMIRITPTVHLLAAWRDDLVADVAAPIRARTPRGSRLHREVGGIIESRVGDLVDDLVDLSLTTLFEADQ